MNAQTKGRHAKTRQMVTFSCFRMATFRPARQRYDKQEAKRRRMTSVVRSCGGAKGRHAKTRKVTIWRVFAWRLFAFSPWKHVNTTWHKSATINIIEIFLLQVYPWKVVLNLTTNYRIRCHFPLFWKKKSSTKSTTYQYRRSPFGARYISSSWVF